MPGYACRTINEFDGHLSWLLTKKYDIYFCLSRQAERGKPDRRGNPMADRHAKNALALKAIWLDIDVKPDDGYATMNEAEDALAKFVADAKMPVASAIVCSGSGLHVYWISDTPFSVAEWQLYADGLKTLAMHHGLKCDYGLTIDSARVLRVPGTYNHKTNPPKPVVLKPLGASHNFATALAHVAAVIPVTLTVNSEQVMALDLSKFQGKKPSPLFAHLDARNDNLAEGIYTQDDTPLDYSGVFIGCPHFRHTFETHGAENGQGLWMLDVLASTFFDDGYRIAHTLSKGYETYAGDETDRMWDRKKRERGELGLGWPGCSAFENEGCKLCATCAHRGKIKSPLNLAAPVSPPTADDQEPPPAAPTLAAWNVNDLRVSFSNIPHRRWLYGTYLIRGEITVLAAPGGVGKTALATGVAIEIATDTVLLGEKIYRAQPLKVLFINGEDGASEIHRRVLAFCLAHAHKLGGQNLDRLYVAGADDPRVQRLSFLKTTDRNFSMLDQSGFQVLESALETLQPDLLVLDPLVAFCGGGNMNDNAVMAQVIRELKRLATKRDCAVLVVHHTRKGADDGNAEGISGASATVNLARRALMPVPMTEDEAKKLGVLPSERFRYFKLVDAKSNLAPRSADSPWYRLNSVELPNPEPPVYPYGDNVQAVQRVNLLVSQAAPATTDNQKIWDAIIDLVDRGKMIDGKSYPYSPSLAGAHNTRSLLDDAMAAVASATAPRQWPAGDLKAVTERAITKLRECGVLVEEEMPSTGRFRRGRALRFDRSRIPDIGRDWTDDGAASDEDDPPDPENDDGGQLVNSRSID